MDPFVSQNIEETRYFFPSLSFMRRPALVSPLIHVGGKSVQRRKEHRQQDELYGLTFP